MPVTIKIAVFC